MPATNDTLKAFGQHRTVGATKLYYSTPLWVPDQNAIIMHAILDIHKPPLKTLSVLSKFSIEARVT